ncbi:hypothetical protein ACF0HT_13530 (plasmid) [Staphylococcus xylosus]|uniref:hypothetical protein n=1 Tax=Staphylococcus xylosus TaxID=1288 RepID=UPI003747C498
MNVVLKTVYNIDKWIRPYAYIHEGKIEKATVKSKPKKVNNKGKKKRPVLTPEEEKAKKEFLKTGAIGVDLVTINGVMTENKALERLSNSASSVAYYCHESGHHQIAVKFDKGSAWKYHERNEGKRKKLKPIIEHQKRGLGDKTHLIPIGFHGSENDERLLVRFDSKINRGKLKKSEEYVSKINIDEPILWFVDIVKQDDKTAIWYMTVWRENGDIILQKSFHDKNKFIWV